jgi:Ca2+-binding RTX toxin-like protein
MKKPLSNSTKLGIECLERREFMAGNIHAYISNQGVLDIVGSNGNDAIYVRQAHGVITVEGVGSIAANRVRAIEVDAGAGNDTVVLLNPQLQSGVDYITKPSVIFGGSGNDTLVGGASFDLISGGSGNDQIFGTWGNDLLVGGDGNDEIYGGSGNDFLFGANGDDHLFGGSGNDYINGGNNWDTMSGGDGNDLLVGGPGWDQYHGNAGVNYLVDSDNWGYAPPNYSGYDFYYTYMSSQVTMPGLNYQPTSTGSGTALQSILGPDLYSGIFVNHTIPASIYHYVY